MTEQEAIKWINDRMCYGRGKWSEHHQPVIDEYWQARELAMQALNKQIPMKLKVLLGNVRKCETPCLITCPTCGVLLEDGYRPRYIPSWKNGILHCDMCGQAIDLSEYEKHETAKD